MKAILALSFLFSLSTADIMGIQSKVVDFTEPTSACNAYKCADPDSYFPQGVCIDPQQDHINLLKACTSKQAPYCDPKISPTEPVICSAAPTPNHKYNSFPGEGCEQESDCVYGTCENKVCKGTQQGYQCQNSGECEPGHFCEDVCIVQRKIGQSCEKNEQCVNSAGCQKQICTPYYSLPEGTSVENCISASKTSKMCESGYCYDQSPFTTTGTCIDAPVSKNIPPFVCNDDLDCFGQNMGYDSIPGKCVCGFNEDGYSYCQPFDGDAPGIDLMTSFKDILKNEDNHFCNTERRFNMGCLQWGDPGIFEVFFDNLFKFQNYAKMVGNDECVKSIYLQEYYKGATSLILGVALLVVFN